LLFSTIQLAYRVIGIQYDRRRAGKLFLGDCHSLAPWDPSFIAGCSCGSAICALRLGCGTAPEFVMARFILAIHV
jgi:hypothetical protein